MKKKIILASVMSVITTMTFVQPALSGVNQWIDAQMQGQSNIATGYLLLLLGGLLASLIIYQ